MIFAYKLLSTVQYNGTKDTERNGTVFGKVLAVSSEVNFLVDIACVRILYESATITTNWLPDVVPESSPRISTRTKFKGPLRKKCSSLR